MSDDVAVRVANLIDSITFQVFQYTTRGLFECDKLIFTSQMAFQILLMKDEINPSELDFLLRFPIQANQVSPVEFITNSGWGAIKSLALMEEFRNLDRDIENNAKRYQKLIMKCLHVNLTNKVEEVCRDRRTRKGEVRW